MDNPFVVISPNATEEDLSSNLFNETQGPRKGISLSFEKAQRLIQFHLPNKLLDRLTYVNRGYNNRVYLVCCTDASEYVIRLGGRFWDHKKITNERMALQLAQEALGDTVQVPRILGTSIEEAKIHIQEDQRIISHDYIIMSRLPGVPLDSVWDNMTLQDKKIVLDQAADIFGRLRSIKLDSIGNFIEGPNGEPTVGPLMESGGGPFHSWEEFIAGNIRQELKNMKEKKEDFAELVYLTPRIEALIKKVESGELEKQFSRNNTHSEGSTAERPISFLHGDFESRNMLVVGTQITGIHDFEFAGGFPSEQEWCAGFEWVFGRAEDPFDDTEQQKIRDMTYEQKELLEHFLKVLKEKHGIIQYGKSNQEYKVIIYHLQVNIAPWWLRDPPRKSWTENQKLSIETAASSLDKALTYLGC
ncbi:hypothetical protein BGZ76_003904 [Entomortierella beljakovae]|nr:hypothetical protein BGZ76_003904 [Entomortierella beljakovae]